MIVDALDKIDLEKIKEVFSGDNLNKFLTVAWWTFSIFYVIAV